MLTTREAAARLGVHERTVRRAIARGEIPALKRHGAYVISAAVIDRLAPPLPAPKLIALTPAPDGMEPLPVPLTPLIGRAEERARVSDLLRGGEVRLLTMTGPGGIGKTRLAIAVAGEVAADFPDGVVFVDLTPITREEFVLAAIAEALGLRESARQELQQRVRAFLRRRRILMILDNVEHLIAAAPMIAQVLTNAPRLVVLATSRLARAPTAGSWAVATGRTGAAGTSTSAATAATKRPPATATVRRPKATDPSAPRR